jgi:HlyD family secretion protein
MKRVVVVIVLLAALAGGAYWWHVEHRPPPGALTLFGNVDLRQVGLAFNNSERIAAVAVQEGARVKKGDVVARLDTLRIAPQVAQAAAQAAAQKQVVTRLRHGSRPEEIAQARANVEMARADAANAKLLYDRLKKLSDRSQGEAVSAQDLDNARSALAVADAKQVVSERALDLAVAGPRQEDVDEAEARLKAFEAQLQFLRQQLADAELVAPVDAVVRTRLMEPGEMASPQKPVVMLAVTNPKWIRAYVSEPNLGKLREGLKATIQVDSFPERQFEGWVGFISPVAEFTPKAIQTEELRTSLVYEVRVFVTDPNDELRLGMPATVRLAESAAAE